MTINNFSQNSKLYFKVLQSSKFFNNERYIYTAPVKDFIGFLFFLYNLFFGKKFIFQGV